ncbi:hypothetical protein T440DRAFT_472212 [Plenodomus tracheiphilus IPT5]|uniref:Phenylacetaldoxime dehydratase n=1 Tax=Plenodomus tracheiphilus IPT5 TaxID=1408161 RepID=A0A6A7ARX7_9PLEO|nr:hypothetical protein T440DRAFT_472212 [Plenodomus tracheiphilus IPT5]
MSCPVRIHPLRKPPNHRVPIPRWKLSLPESCHRVFTTYVGLQQHDFGTGTTGARWDIINAIQDWLRSNEESIVWESFSVIDGHDVEESPIWVCYFADTSQDRVHVPLDLSQIHSRLDSSVRDAIGIWQESFATEVSRLETNYSGLDYLPGLARLQGAQTDEHTLSTYWGAARDRIPDSAHDLFPRSSNTERPSDPPVGLGQHLMGTNHNNLVHIRSGQWWENCGQQEADAYEKKLEPTLRAGLEYLCNNTDQTGAMGLRYLRNSKTPGESKERKQKESCGAGFFANLEDLENWAKTHPSHLKIWRGALSHYKEFGDHRRFRTWHEVCVIREGNARFEYINCAPGTGVMRSMPLQIQHSWSAV